MSNEAAVPGEDSQAGAENFAALLDESFAEGGPKEGSVVRGTVINVENDSVLIDVGLKAEGRVALKEFAAPGQESEIRSAIASKFISNAWKIGTAKLS